jgi:6-phospho-beta-glucosidase
MKITVIGGGSTYTPELVNGFLRRASSLDLSELCLMDTDEGRLAAVGGFARRMIAADAGRRARAGLGGESFELALTTDRRAALSGAAYVITQIRVGRMAARREDEYLGRRHGLVGQETTGVGGMANALRTIPVILDIAADIRELAPAALLLNFANPAGLVTEALARYAPEVDAVGVCNVGINAKMLFLELYERISGEKAEPERAELDTLGLNHLSWHRGFRIDGVDLWPRLFPAYIEESCKEGKGDWDRATLETLGMAPNYYLEYFYYTERKIEAQKAWPPSRAEEVMLIEGELLGRYADPALDVLPEELMKRGGAYYSELATRVIDDHRNDRGGVHVVNAKNGGAVPEWPADWVLEFPARVDRSGVHPLPAPALKGAPAALVASVKAYELLVVEAAVKGDRRAAHEALLAHPLGPEADRVAALLEDMLASNRALLPRFFS